MPPDLHPIDVAIDSLLNRAIETLLLEHCNEIEAARIRLAIQHPSEHIDELIDDCHTTITKAIVCTVPMLFNAILYPEP
jgi:hypothetical protein